MALSIAGLGFDSLDWDHLALEAQIRMVDQHRVTALRVRLAASRMKLAMLGRTAPEWNTYKAFVWKRPAKEIDT